MNNDDIGIYNFKVLRRGDTFRARDIATVTSSVDNSPVAISAARMMIRTKSGVVVHDFRTDGDTPNASIIGDDNVVHLNAIAHTVTEDFPAGSHTYVLKIQLASDGAWQSILTGDFPVAANPTRAD